MSQPDDAQSAIRALAGDLTHRWLTTGEIPDDAIEASAPALRELLGAGTELSFDDFQHRDYVRPGWALKHFHAEDFPAPFELYLPATWRIIPTEEPGVGEIFDQEDRRRQVLQVAGKSVYGDAVDGAIYSGDLLGFEVGRDYGQFIRWRFVAGTPEGYDVWSIFSAGDAALVSLGEAADVDELKVQLTSSVNSIPWHYWIKLSMHEAEPNG